MPTQYHPAMQTSFRHQRGAATLLMILTLIVILTIVLAPRLTLWQVHNAATDRGYQTLIDAKAAILAHAGGPDADVPPMAPLRRLGQISLTPDLPAAAGTTYTGIAGVAPGAKPGCATNTWVPGQALTDPNNANAATAPTIRCFGRLPWLSFGLQGPSTPDDAEGSVPWMFLSANLVVGSACFPNLNPLMLSRLYPVGGGGCSTGVAVPFPWLTVVDDRGNVLSTEVAIVLILPGPPLTNAQQRIAPTDHSPAAYLDSMTVAATCPAPCVPGTYNNAAYTVAGALPWTFIDAPPSTALGSQPAYYTQPFTFNDRMIYITASEYFEAMEVHARGYLLGTLGPLQQYKSINGYLPYSGDKVAPLTTNCTKNPPSRLGLLSLGAPCSAPPNAPALTLLPSFTSAGWQNYFIYAVDASCVQSWLPLITRCQLPPGQGLQLGAAATRYNAVLFSPGRAIQKAPFAVTKPGAPQAPIATGLIGGALADFLDSVANVGGPPFDAAGTAPTANYDDRMYGIP
jgi:hypothetical protein